MLLFSFLSAILLHECGHMIALCLFRAKLVSARVTPFGMTLTHTPLSSPCKNAAVALSGPLFGIIGYIVSHYSGHFPLFSMISLYLSLFNLIPIASLDGNRILRSLLEIFFAPHTSDCCSLFISKLSLLSLWLIGTYSFFLLDGSPSLFLMALTLFFQGMKHEESLKIA